MFALKNPTLIRNQIIFIFWDIKKEKASCFFHFNMLSYLEFTQNLALIFYGGRNEQIFNLNDSKSLKIYFTEEELLILLRHT